MSDDATTHSPQVDFDPLDQAWRFHDGPIYARLRDAGGIAGSSTHGGFWATADLALVKQVTDARRLVSRRPIERTASSEARHIPCALEV